jgi:small subunit ribosomal protein S21
MIIVKVEHNNLEKALKIYKSKVIKTRQMTKLNDLKTFVKKSIKRRNEVLKAEHSEKIRQTEKN